MKTTLLLLLVSVLLSGMVYADVDQSLTSSEPPVIDHWGGPDDFTYIFKDSDEPGGPVYDWIDISATGTEVAFNDQLGDDDYIGPYAIGFSFPFYGNDRTQVYLHSNGVISFEDWGNAAGSENTDIQDIAGLLWGASLCFYWDNLDPDNGEEGDPDDSKVYYQTLSVDDQPAMVISYINVDVYPAGSLQENLTAQVILFEDGQIRFQYNNFSDGWDIDSETIAMVNDDFTIFLQATMWDMPTAYPSEGIAIDFYMDPDADAILAGTVLDFDTGVPIEGATVTAGIFSSITDESGYYFIDHLYPVPYSIGASAPGYFDFEPMLVALSPGVNTYDIEMEVGPLLTHFFDFNSGPFPFTSTGPIWEHGVPLVEPDEAYSPPNAWGTNLAGDHGQGEQELLISLPFLVESPMAYMSYWHWFEYDYLLNGYNVLASIDDGATFQLLEPFGGYPDLVFALPEEVGFTGSQLYWDRVSFPLGAYEGQDVIIAFQHATAEFTAVYSGVTIDDFSLYLTDWEPPDPDPVTLTLIPSNNTVPADGGPIYYDATLESQIGLTMPGLWYQTFATLPNGAVFGPIDNIPFTLVPFMNFTATNMVVIVPENAPAGGYLFEARAGNPGNPAQQVSDSFGFTKLGVVGDNFTFDPDEWQSGNSFVVEREAAVNVELPSEYAVGDAYPNPFNPSTSVMIALPQASELTVSVFNVMGQQVATLANGKFNAGQHTFSFDASNLSSGIYFVHAHVPGELNKIQKITLMK
jgi:Secretion system C-terminal sorting domain/Carboxypeptidase regulatory-like domain